MRHLAVGLVALGGCASARREAVEEPLPAGTGYIWHLTVEDAPGHLVAAPSIVTWASQRFNVTMAQAFHTVWVSYSDDGGQTWTPQQAFDAGVGHDTSTPFVAFTVDRFVRVIAGEISEADVWSL